MADIVITKENVADLFPPENGGWRRYRKTSLTYAIKLDQPFIVQTSEGPLRCTDGYLALDARGYPYPIATSEFGMIYEEDHDPDGLGYS